MWSGYSTHEAAEVVGLSESSVRACARAGLLAKTEAGVTLRFSFRDLAVLKLVKALTTRGVSMRRVRKQLRDLRGRLPESTSLAELAITEEGGHVIVRDVRRSWRADSGQLLLDFVVEEPAGEVTPLVVPREAIAPEPVRELTADEWFDQAIELEEEDPDAAIVAYRRARRLRPTCTETLINLGRLYAETGARDQADVMFREAIALDPTDATALYNLGVVAQDGARDDEAIELYERALQLDPLLAEAHYNLATVFDRTGDPHAAIRHINEYRKLVK